MSEALQHCCPTCRQPVANGGVMINAPEHLIWRNGKTLLLPPTEMTIFRLLYRRFPGLVSIEALVNEVYGLNRDRCPSAIAVMIYRLKWRITALDMGIRNVRGEGYALTIDGVQP